MSFAHPYLLAFGVLFLVAAVLLWRWAGRHDLKGLAVDAAWQVAKARGDVKAQSELSDRLQALKAEESHTGRAKMVAGHAARHVAAQVASIAALVSFVAGAALIGLALYWK